MSDLKELLRNQYNNLSDIRYDVDLLLKRLPTKEEIEAMNQVLEAINYCANWPHYRCDKPDFTCHACKAKDAKPSVEIIEKLIARLEP